MFYLLNITDWWTRYAKLGRHIHETRVTGGKTNTFPDARKVCHWLIIQICGWLVDWLLNTLLRMHNFNLRANYFVQYSAFGMECNLVEFYSLLNSLSGLWIRIKVKCTMIIPYKSNIQKEKKREVLIFLFFFYLYFSQTCQTYLVKTRKHSIFHFVISKLKSDSFVDIVISSLFQNISKIS